MKNNPTTFVLINPRLSGFSFNGYLDENGDSKFIVSHNDTNGNSVYRRFKWPRGSRTFVIPGVQKHVADFFRNSPFCEGSPVQMANPYFKELNPEKDADIMVEEETNRILAQSEVLKLNKEQLADIAMLCGYEGPSEKLQRQRVLSYAKNQPIVFMDMLKSKSLDSDVLVKRCLSKGVIVKKGFMFNFDEIHLGNSIDAVVKKVMDDEKLKGVLTERLSKAK